MSISELRLRLDFANPTKGEADIKHKLGEVMDIVDGLQLEKTYLEHCTTHDATFEEMLQYGEFARLKSIALSKIEEACMWAVKAATYEEYLKSTKQTL